MRKTRKQPTIPAQTCADCVHEFACKIWTDGRELSPENAAICPQFKRTKDTAAYLIGKLDGAESAVKHGLWLDKYNDCSCAECTVCGEFYETTDQDCVTADSFKLFQRFYKFCPNCGAKMDETDSNVGNETNRDRLSWMNNVDLVNWIKNTAAAMSDAELMKWMEEEYHG